jgi:hypothetical protein
VRKAAAEFKSLSGIGNKVKLACSTSPHGKSKQKPLPLSLISVPVSAFLGYS